MITFDREMQTFLDTFDRLLNESYFSDELEQKLLAVFPYINAEISRMRLENIKNMEPVSKDGLILESSGEQTSIDMDFSDLDAMIEKNYNEENIGHIYSRLVEEVRSDNVSGARHLIEKAKLDVEYPGVLDSAIMGNHLEMTGMLIEHGADVKNCTPCLGPILVDVCMAYGTKEGAPNYTEMIELLLKNGATLFYDGKDYGECLCDDSKPPQFLCSPEARELLAQYLPDNQNRYCDIENGKKLWRPHPPQKLGVAAKLEAAKKQVAERAAAAPPMEHTQSRSSGHSR